MNIPRVMIAAPSSGSGKSVITSALMAAFSKHECVQGFKVGPDYIDPMYHTLATGRSSRNLDTWMLPSDKVTRIFTQASQGASLSLIEGVMGLFDGHGSNPFDGSSAAVAELLGCPVVLVLDCSKMSGSAAAVVHGMNTFSPSLRLSGVICNRVGSEGHAQWLKAAIEKYTPVPVLGCVPRLLELQIPERHLGLFTVAERPLAAKEFIQQAADIVSGYIDLDHLRQIAGGALPISCSDESDFTALFPKPDVRLAVARDEAFCFYYEENLDALRLNGAQIVPFSPLTDSRLPEGISGIYFGGGYPELYARELQENSPLRGQISELCRNGMPVYAECGGLMYLTRGIVIGAERYSMAGVLPGWCFMGTRLTMGYREIVTAAETLLGAPGLRLRGHEFHYSNWTLDDSRQAAYQVLPRKTSDMPAMEGFAGENLLASYIHLHFAQEEQLARNFVQRCRDWQTTSKKLGDL